MKEIEVNVAYRLFLRMSLTEIHASILIQNRIRCFNGTNVFERIFINIVDQRLW